MLGARCRRRSAMLLSVRFVPGGLGRTGVVQVVIHATRREEHRYNSRDAERRDQSLARHLARRSARYSRAARSVAPAARATAWSAPASRSALTVIRPAKITRQSGEPARRSGE